MYVNLLRQFIIETITEITRADKEGIELPSTLEQLQQYIGGQYFIHFSNLIKVGLNPVNKYNTPLEFYTYQLN